jgi:CRP-like cAMP-binding protein/uncharacterized protein (DUF2249 family)
VANSENLDFSGVPVWERRPLILEALDRVPHGDAITFITDIEPRGISARALDERFGPVLVETSTIGPARWRVSISRRQSDAGRDPVAVLLESCAPFARLSPTSLGILAAAGVSQSARRGRLLLDENITWPFVGVVAEGVVAISTGSGPRQHIIYEMFPHDTFGMASFFDRGTPIGSVIAMTKTARIVKMPWDVVAEIARTEPELFFGLGAELARRQRLLAGKLMSQSALPIVGRVARVLLPHAMEERGLSPAMPALASMTQSQIAAAAGTVKEVAARAIAELDERGLLRREHGHIRFLDRQGIVELLKELGGS